MDVLKRLLGLAGGAVPKPPEIASDAQALVSEGYDRESVGDAAGAEALYRRAIELEPEHSMAYYLLARLADFDRRTVEAISLLRQAVELSPDESLYRLGLAGALLSARQHGDALEQCDEVIKVLPNCAAARINRCAALIELNRRPEALPELERLRTVLPDTRQVHFNLGSIYREYALIDEAIEEYRKTRDLSPEFAPSYSNLILILNYSPNHGPKEIFEEHRRFGERFCRRYLPPRTDFSWPRRIRVGYVSPDFRAHVVARFLEPILANHDRKAFEVFCYHTHPDVDEATEAFSKLAEHWLHCDELSDEELAERIRADRIDILVDLAGHTAGNRLMMFAMKPAPVQMTYLGYPHTSGVPAVDFHVTDAFADPPSYDAYNVERQLRLPGSYFCYRTSPGTPDPGPLPAEKNGFVTFGCFNNFYKISGHFLDMAADVLHAVPHSRFMLKGRPLSVPEIADRVRRRFHARGIDATRLELRGWEKGFSQHLTLYHALDIALDSYPYNGATTTCEALWMGVPVVSRRGDRHAARMGASLLNGAGLPELVTDDENQFVAVCQRLAKDLPALSDLRRGLRQRLIDSPLMDEKAFIRKLEDAYRAVWIEHRERASASVVPAASSTAQLLDDARRARASGDIQTAVAACIALLERQPGHSGALAELSDIAFEIGRPGLAVDRLLKGIAAAPSDPQIHYLLGCALQAVERVEDAAASFLAALERDASHAKAHNNLGCLLESVGRLDEAMQRYAAAFEADPRLAHAAYNLGNAYRQIGARSEAVRHIAEAVAIDPSQPEWWCNLGNLYYEQLDLDQAIDCFSRALRMDPQWARAHENLGATLLLQGQVSSAAESFNAALRIKPNDARIAQWPLLHMLYRGAEDRNGVLQAHRSWAERHASIVPRSTAHPRKLRKRLRVAYLSPDLCRHPVAFFVEPLLTYHDRSAFDVWCYSTSPGIDDVSERLAARCERWRDVSGLNEEDLANRIRADAIDILVDLAGHTGGGRMLVMARKPAPLQGTYLGYPATTGVGAIDFRFTDAVADPEGENDGFHVEKLVRLPGGFLCFAPPKDSPAPQLPPERPIAFGCFNHAAKITPDMLAVWARLLGVVPGSRLILKSHGFASVQARQAFLGLAARQGIASERLEFLPFRHEHASHLEEYGAVDIALDVFPYNGTTTTCEALWMGVPVVTLCGKSHAARVGASILTAASLPQFVAGTPESYVGIASALAADSAGRAQLRMDLRATLQRSALLDGRRLAQGIEAAYRSMWQHYAKGQRPRQESG